MHPDKAAGKWKPKRHVSTKPKDHEHPPLPLADRSGPVEGGKVITEPKALSKQEKREKAADAETP